MTKPLVDIDGATFPYGGEAALKNRHIPAIQIFSDARFKNVRVPRAAFASVHNGANVSISDSTNTTPSHAVVAENAGDVTVERFSSERISIGWTRTFAEGWNSTFGKRN